ncbi:hypothetical protein QA597_11270 [Marinilabiliaceae bacterium ANBcel2]|nr:hypothetical protein [Marinilabiliaceae bacterium ANBcel2]
MHKLIRNLLTGIVIITSINTVHSQSKTYSPFSRHGLGELNYRGFGRNDAMGNTGIGVRSSLHLNSMNPASYNAIDSTSFFFEAGISNYIQQLKLGDDTQTFSDIDYDYFALGIPLSSNAAVSVGLRPAVRTGYEFELIDNGDNPVGHRALGTGNITSLYGGFAYNVTPELSLGVHGTYWFGDITHTSFQEFINDPHAYKYGVKNEHDISTFFIDFGAQYTHQLSDQRHITVGAVFRPTTSMNGSTSALLARSLSNYDIEGNLFMENDTVSSGTYEIDWNGSIAELPAKYGIGASYVIEDKLTLAADYERQQWGEVNFPDNISQLANSQYIGAGAEYIPDLRTGSGYFQRVRYRAGIHYREDYLKIDGDQIQDIGMSFGLGLPVGRTRTSINLGVEFGKRSTNSNQISENYTRISLNFTMHENWFRQRRIQ